MEHTELQATRVAYATEVGLKEQALRTKQQNEMKVLLKRAAQGSDELRKTRDLELERCSQVWYPVSFCRLIIHRTTEPKLISKSVVFHVHSCHHNLPRHVSSLVLQRHKNIAREFRALQKQERMRFEQILGKRVKEFKESGGSLQLLSETLSGMEAWMLPAIEPLCPAGDTSTFSCSSDSHGSD